MGKGPKLQLSFLNTIQICRPKDVSSLVKSPLPTLTHFSTLNSKTYDISLPSFQDPPPSPRHHLSTKCKVESSNITPLRSKSCTMHGMTSYILNDEFSSQAYSGTRKEDKEKEKLYDSPFPSSIAPSRIEKKKEKTTKKEPKARVNTSFSLADNDDEKGSSHGFNNPLRTDDEKGSSHGFNNPLRTITEEESKKSVRQRSVRTRRFKRFGSKEWKDGSITELEYKSPERKPVSSGGLAPCMVDRKVNPSFVVVKRSMDPCEDFKKSMLEMIVEKQMFEPKELEQLLMSFLSLNSRMHHKAILKAFTEIWKEVFSGSSN